MNFLEVLKTLQEFKTLFEQRGCGMIFAMEKYPPQIYTMGAYLRPMKIDCDDGKECWVWHVEEFEGSNNFTMEKRIIHVRLRELLIIYSAIRLPKRIINSIENNMYGTAAKTIVIEAANQHFESLYNSIQSLVEIEKNSPCIDN
ncbi:MAG: hypothetical protein LBG43_11730 [Treponema sp.]|jgi:hypothetical protein|nr:hypothetical protein [Treponema sp.]